MTRGERRALAAVLLLAGALRIAACFHWRDDLSRDPDAYRGLAERLAAGDGYVALDGRATAFRPPLYPLMLAGVIGAGAAGIAAVQVALGVGTVALTASLGRRLGLGPWSLPAAGLVAVDPLLMRYTPQVMTEVTCAFLAVLVLWLGSSGRPLLAGAAFGLATLSRPTFWAFGALAAGWWVASWWASRRTGPLPARQAVLTLLGVVVVVSPWVIRNVVVMGRPVLTTTHGGYTLLLANNPVFWREVVEGPPGAVWGGASLAAWQRSLEVEMTTEGVPADEVARDRWMRDRGVRHIRERPGMFLRSAGYRVRRLWDVVPAAEEVPRVVRWGVGMFYAVTFATAAVGVVRILSKRRRGQYFDEGGQSRTASWSPSLLLIAAFTAVHSVYWTDARMRAPVVPAVALLAAVGVAGTRDRQKTAET